MGKILFNGLLYSKNGAGVSNYTKNLVQQLSNQKNLEFILSEEVKNNFKNNGNMKFIKGIKSSKSRIVFEQLLGLSEYKRYDIVHFPDYSTPIFCNKKKVATIHDLAFHTVKDCYTFPQVLLKKFLLNQTIKRADKLICISEFTYTELKKYYPMVQDEKIEVIYNGFNRPNSNFREISLEKFNIKNEYILFVGTISPSKNLVRLIEAMKFVIEEYPKIKLVIVGRNGWKYDEVYNKVSELKLENNIIFTGYVSNDELESLYLKSLYVVYPSLYEGFGLPPLEALSRNKAVLVSDIPALKEILKDAVFYCDPYSVEDITKNMLDLISKKDYRESKYFRAQEIIDYYSWEKCAQKTKQVYEKLIGGK